MKTDLHIHSTASDGKLTPSQIVQQGALLGLKALAITDHDSVAGLPEALEAAGSLSGLIFIPGIEMSTELAGVSMHILGYYIEPNSPILPEFLLKQRLSREERAKRILEKLARLGMEIKWEVVEEIAGNSPIGRPHIAQAIVREGYVSSVKEAFTRYLDWGAPAYLPRKKASPREVIQVIDRAGGIAVLAHPYDLTRKGLDIEQVTSYLIGQGLRGMEVYYNSYSLKQSQRLAEIARRLKLFIVGGSDFHGLDASETPLGEIDMPEEEIAPFVSQSCSLLVKPRDN